MAPPVQYLRNMNAERFTVGDEVTVEACGRTFATGRYAGAVARDDGGESVLVVLAIPGNRTHEGWSLRKFITPNEVP